MGGAVGSLTVVGTGIQAAGQITIEARAYVEQADKLLFLVADPTTAHYLRKLNPSAESLHGFYETGKRRLTSYMEMTERILEEVRKGLRVCAAFYGHPGVFTYPSHEAIRQARREGFIARMLPGISAEDCLFADLGIDPSMVGSQSFEATDFLIFKREFDIHCSLILWQIGVIGDLSFQAEGYDFLVGMQILAEYLEGFYGPEHRVIIYEASHYPVYEPVIDAVTVSALRSAKVTAISTLYVPPKGPAPLDEAMFQRVGLTGDVLHTRLEVEIPVRPRPER